MIKRVYVNLLQGMEYPYEVELMTTDNKLVEQAQYATLKEAVRRGKALGKYHGVDTYVFTGTLYDKTGRRFDPCN